MFDSSNLRLRVRNFGPIGSGEVEFRPLTILIGPNNSGKSYLAHLAYALWKALSGDLRRPLGTEPSFTDYLERQLRDAQERLPFEQLPPERQEILRLQLDRSSASVDDLDESLRRYFGSPDSRELVRGGSDRRTLTIEIDAVRPSSQPFISLEVDADGLSASWTLANIARTHLPLSAGPTLSLLSDDPYTQSLFARHLWLQMLAANGFPNGAMHYLPAARSGIMTGLEAYTTAAIDRVWRGAGSQPIAIAPFPGVAADFLQAMVSLLFSPDGASNGDKPLRSALDVLEGNVLKGRISTAPDGWRRLSIVYEASGMEMPIQRTSAMVAELAPLDLWMKHLLRPGDVLIIDEPEAHLHPENQRLIARVLVRLVRSGVRVVCPTHSSLILHQISNHLLATRSDPKEREALGFLDDDMLGVDELGVYLFQPGAEGSSISSVPIEPDWGISEEEFLRVSEAIGEETYRLSTLYGTSLVGP